MSVIDQLGVQGTQAGSDGGFHGHPRPSGGLRVIQPLLVGQTRQEKGPGQAAAEGESLAAPPECSDLMAGLGMSPNEFRDVFRYAFDRFDLDGNGELSPAEFQCALRTMGLKLKTGEALALFRALAGGQDRWVPNDLGQDPGGQAWLALQGAVAKQYQASGLSGLGLILANVKDTMSEGSVGDRFKSMVSTLGDHRERLVEQLEAVLNVLGTALAGYSVVNELIEGESLDFLSMAPLLLLIWKTSTDANQAIADALTTDLCQDHAKVFARVFKPAGFALTSYQRLCAEADATWLSVPKGAQIPQECLNQRLLIISKGQVKVMQQSSAPGLHETLATLGAGMLLGHSDLLGTDRVGSSLFGGSGQVMVAEEETLILQLDRQKLRQYIKVDESACQAFYYAITRSQTHMMSMVNRRARKIADELPLFFRDLALGAASGLRADRATFWIYDAKESALWTLFVAEDGSSSYVSIDHGSGLAGHCFTQGEIVNIPDCYQDKRFNADVDRTTGYRTQNMLCVPIIDDGALNNKDGQVIGVLQLVNKVPNGSAGRLPEQLRALPHLPVFTSEDEKDAIQSMKLTALIVKKLIDRYHSGSRLQQAETQRAVCTDLSGTWQIAPRSTVQLVRRPD